MGHLLYDTLTIEHLEVAVQDLASNAQGIIDNPRELGTAKTYAGARLRAYNNILEILNNMRYTVSD